MPPIERTTERRRPICDASGDAAKRILLVEDEHLVALDLRGALEDMGYEVVGTAASSDEALRKAGEQRPDLVLMDIHLAGVIDGIQAATLLRYRYQLPVVYLTAYSDSATLESVLEAEPDGYLTKPYNQRTLWTTIEVAFRRHESELALRRTHDEEKDARATDRIDGAEPLREERSLVLPALGDALHVLTASRAAAAPEVVAQDASHREHLDSPSASSERTRPVAR